MLNVCDLTLWSGASMVVASSGRHPQLDHLVDAGRFDQLVSHPAALWLKRVFHQSSLWVPSAIATWRPVKPAVAPAGPGSASFAGAGSGSVSSTRTLTCRASQSIVPTRRCVRARNGCSPVSLRCPIGVPIMAPRRCPVDVLSVSLRCSVGVTPNESSNEHANE